MNHEVVGDNGGSSESKESEIQQVTESAEREKARDIPTEVAGPDLDGNGGNGAPQPEEHAVGNNGSNGANGALKVGTGEPGKNGEPANNGEKHLEGRTSNGKATGEPSKVAGTKGRPPTRARIEEVEPWPERVNLAEVLDEIVRQLLRFVIFPKWAAEMLALWIVHTFAYEHRDVATYVGIESPEKECGKSTLITLLSLFVNRPAVSSNISSSAFFHVIEELRPTLLIDEGDTNLRGKDDLMGILNSSYTRATGFVWRISFDPVRRGRRTRARLGRCCWIFTWHSFMRRWTGCSVATW